MITPTTIPAIAPEDSPPPDGGFELVEAVAALEDVELLLKVVVEKPVLLEAREEELGGTEVLECAEELRLEGRLELVKLDDEV